MEMESNLRARMSQMRSRCWWAVVKVQKRRTTTMARLKMSVRQSYFSLEACSGELNSFVPTDLLNSYSSYPPSPCPTRLPSYIELFQYRAFLARPKSINLHLPLSARTTLCSLTSRCIILWEWRYPSPLVISRASSQFCPQSSEGSALLGRAELRAWRKLCRFISQSSVVMKMRTCLQKESFLGLTGREGRDCQLFSAGRGEEPADAEPKTMPSDPTESSHRTIQNSSSASSWGVLSVCSSSENASSSIQHPWYRRICGWCSCACKRASERARQSCSWAQSSSLPGRRVMILAAKSLPSSLLRTRRTSAKPPLPRGPKSSKSLRKR